MLEGAAKFAERFRLCYMKGILVVCKPGDVEIQTYTLTEESVFLREDEIGSSSDGV